MKHIIQMLHNVFDTSYFWCR